VAETVPPLRRALRRFARRRGASPAVQARVSLAFSEACIVLLGQADAAHADAALLIVEADADGDTLTVRVSASRHGLLPRFWRERQGFELALLTQACDRVAIEHRRQGSGMAVTTRRGRRGPSAPSPPPNRRPARESARSSRGRGWSMQPGSVAGERSRHGVRDPAQTG
jgi:anti-sigma regulatory factor (Ser/Thr protein kinase)